MDEKERREEHRKRLDKAVDATLQLFTDLGLTMDEANIVASCIAPRVKLQSTATKLDAKLIQTVMQQQYDEREAEVERAIKNNGFVYNKST